MALRNAGRQSVVVRGRLPNVVANYSGPT